eukprot:7880147-Pyramimonas_sp.AAC.1
MKRSARGPSLINACAFCRFSEFSLTKSFGLATGAAAPAGAAPSSSTRTPAHASAKWPGAAAASSDAAAPALPPEHFTTNSWYAGTRSPCTAAHRPTWSMLRSAPVHLCRGSAPATPRAPRCAKSSCRGFGQQCAPSPIYLPGLSSRSRCLADMGHGPWAMKALRAASRSTIK